MDITQACRYIRALPTAQRQHGTLSSFTITWIEKKMLLESGYESILYLHDWCFTADKLHVVSCCVYVVSMLCRVVSCYVYVVYCCVLLCLCCFLLCLWCVWLCLCCVSLSLVSQFLLFFNIIWCLCFVLSVVDTMRTGRVWWCIVLAVTCEHSTIHLREIFIVHMSTTSPHSWGLEGQGFPWFMYLKTTERGTLLRIKYMPTLSTQLRWREK